MTALSRYEQETVINFNVVGSDAVVYTREKAVMRKLDLLVAEFPECIKVTDVDKTYLMPKKYVKYRRPRRILIYGGEPHIIYIEVF